MNVHLKFKKKSNFENNIRRGIQCRRELKESSTTEQVSKCEDEVKE
jgi:hypothetical protein